MNVVAFEHGKLERNLHLVQIVFVCFQKVDRVAVRFGHTDANVERVHHRLVEVLLEGRFLQRQQIDTMKVALKPKVRLVYLRSNKGKFLLNVQAYK